MPLLRKKEEEESAESERINLPEHDDAFLWYPIKKNFYMFM